jgi:hypothetical protein
MQNHLTKKAEKGKPQTAAHASMSLIGSQRSLKEDRQHAAKVTACRISRSGLAGDFRSSQPLTQILKLITMLLNILFPSSRNEVEQHRGSAGNWRNTKKGRLRDKVGVSAFESGTCFRAAVVRLQLCLSNGLSTFLMDAQIMFGFTDTGGS